METVNIKAIQLDLKKPKLTTIGDFIQNDTNIIKFTLTDNGSVIDLDVIDQILINYKKPSGEVISRVVTAEADVITYQLGFAEMSEAGLGKLVIQFFKSDNRISTFTVDVNIKKSIEGNFAFEEAEKGLVDQVIQEINLVNTRIDNIAFDGVDTSKIATKEDLKTLATKTELSGLATKTELTGLATKTELSQRVKTINGQSPDTAGNINITPGSGTTPENVLLFEDWTPGESIIIGDGGTPETPEPPPPVNTAPSIASSFNMTSALTTTNISIPYSVTDAQGGNLTVTYTKNGTTNTATIATGSNTWNVGTLTAGSHTLKIKVTDSGGLVSNELTFTIAVTQPIEADTTPPNNVTNLVVTNNTTGTSLTLTWTASTSNDVAGYEVYRGTTLLTTVAGTSYNVTGLTANTSYTFNVKAKDTSNNISSGTSVTATAILVDATAPVLTITPTTTFTSTQTVTMTTNETATIYYTLDGNTPTQASPVYSTPLSLSATTTVKAFAKDTAGNVSGVQTVVYTKESGTFNPTIIPSVPSGAYATQQNIQFSTAESGITIREIDHYTGMLKAPEVGNWSSSRGFRLIAEDANGNRSRVQSFWYEIGVTPKNGYTQVDGVVNLPNNVTYDEVEFDFEPTFDASRWNYYFNGGANGYTYIARTNTGKDEIGNATITATVNGTPLVTNTEGVMNNVRQTLRVKLNPTLERPLTVTKLPNNFSNTSGNRLTCKLYGIKFYLNNVLVSEFNLTENFKERMIDKVGGATMNVVSPTAFVEVTN